ncbi:MAG: hypothetical protein IJ717_07605 [Treponema sp.]|nr:hypothetical protein [Treponema sp.]
MSVFKEDSISSAEITADNSLTTNTIDSFAFSDDGDLYTLEHYASAGATVYEIGQYTKTSADYEKGVSKDLSALMESANTSNYTSLDITCHGDYVYVMWSFYSSETECNMTKIGGIKLSNLEAAESFDTEATINDFSATHIAVTDDTLFATTYDTIYSFDNTEGMNNDWSDSSSYTQIDSFTDYGKSIADLHAQDDYIYGLLSYSVMGQTTKGGVFKISTSTKKLCDWSNGSSLLGWNDTASDTPHGSGDYFFNPTNFIATSPKKLVISDDGCRKSSGDDDTDPNNENRVVTIDLETEAMTATDVNVMFDNEKTDCGCTQASAD